MKHLIPVNLLPGPVHVPQASKKCMHKRAVSHRAPEFVTDFHRLKKRLCDLVHSRHVEIVSGSGTTANELVAAHLKSLNKKGLIISNGEFGSRLIDQAKRQHLNAVNICLDWQQPIDVRTIDQYVGEHQDISWLWLVHCETSTGMLHDVKSLQTYCIQKGIKLCLDCVSSIGNVNTDLSRVYMASCSSNKGLGAFPGLGMIFYNHPILPNNKLPRSLDIGLYAVNDGICYTINSNLIYALLAALKKVKLRQQKNLALSSWFQKKLAFYGLKPIISDQNRMQNIFTFQSLHSPQLFGKHLETKNIHISYNSHHLKEKAWFQMCLMGVQKKSKLRRTLRKIKRYQASL